MVTITLLSMNQMVKVLDNPKSENWKGKKLATNIR